MTARRHYANAPITEGLIDIRAALPSDVNIDSIEAVFQQVKSEYPIRQERLFVQTKFSMGPPVETDTKKTPLGYLFRSADGKQVLQARLDGFTFSRLKPYETWDALRNEAKRLWSIYRNTLKPVQITRVAVRYINQIDVPSHDGNIEDYFRTFPEVSPDLSQKLHGFFMQLQIAQEDLDALLLLTQTVAPPSGPNIASIILDIDLFKQKSDFKLDDEVWALLEAFRDRKNEIFEGCLTEKARRLFGPLT